MFANNQNSSFRTKDLLAALHRRYHEKMATTIASYFASELQMNSYDYWLFHLAEYLILIWTVLGVVWSATVNSCPFSMFSSCSVRLRFDLVRSSMLFTVDMYSVRFFPSIVAVMPGEGKMDKKRKSPSKYCENPFHPSEFTWTFHLKFGIVAQVLNQLFQCNFVGRTQSNRFRHIRAIQTIFLFLRFEDVRVNGVDVVENHEIVVAFVATGGYFEHFVDATGGNDGICTRHCRYNML